MSDRLQGPQSTLVLFLTPAQQRVIAIDHEAQRLRTRLSMAADECGGHRPTLKRVTQQVRVSDPLVWAHLAAEYAGERHDLTERYDKAVAPIRQNRSSVQLMFLNLGALPWWAWRRRRTIERQLAQMAVAVCQ